MRKDIFFFILLVEDWCIIIAIIAIVFALGAIKPEENIRVILLLPLM